MEQTRSQIIETFIACLSVSDLGTWGALWADDCVMTLPFAESGSTDRYEGRDAIVDYFATGLSHFMPFIFDDLIVHETPGDLAIAEWHGESVLIATDGHYDQRYIAVFQFDADNKIVDYRQYLNPRAFDLAKQG